MGRSNLKILNGISPPLIQWPSFWYSMSMIFNYKTQRNNPDSSKIQPFARKKPNFGLFLKIFEFQSSLKGLERRESVLVLVIYLPGFWYSFYGSCEIRNCLINQYASLHWTDYMPKKILPMSIKKNIHRKWSSYGYVRDLTYR